MSQRSRSGNARIAGIVVPVLALVVMVAACSGSTPRAGSAGTTSTSASAATTTLPPTKRPDLAVQLIWSAPLTPPPQGTPYATDAVAAAPDGTVYVVDAVKNVVRRYDATGRLVGSWGRPGSGPGEFDFKRISETVLISGIAVDRAGNVFVSEAGNRRIQEFDPTGRFVKLVGQRAAGWAGFVRVIGVTVDDHGSVYSTDGHTDDPIQKFDASGRFVKSWGGDDNRISGQGAAPAGVSRDGIVYVPDNRRSDVVTFDSDGALRSSFGSQAAADGGLSHPGNASVDDQGIVYVADSGNNRICTYDATGRFLGATSGAASGPGRFQSVSYVAARTSGHLFVVDDSQTLLLAFTIATPSLTG